MTILRSIFTAIVFASSILANALAAVPTKTVSPDFAYPQKVSQTSMETLRTALADGDRQATLRALIDYTLAQSSISPANITRSLSLIDSVATVKTIDTVTRAMLNTLRATIYENVYGNQKWKYDRRSLPLTPLPEDINEWSGQQFRDVIARLYDEALADSTALLASPLTDWKNVVEQDRMTVTYYPTLLDFVASKAITTFSSWNNEPAFYPYRLVAEASDANKQFVSVTLKQAPVSNRILGLYSMLIRHSRSGSAPDVNYRLSRLSFLLDNSPATSTDWATARYNAYSELYMSLSDRDGKPESEYVGDILLRLPLTQQYNKKIYDLINSFLKEYPRYWRADCMRNTLDILCHKEIIVEGPHLTAPGRETVIKVIMNNVTDASLKLCDVSSSEAALDFYDTRKSQALKTVATIPLRAKGEIPFSDTLEIRHVFPACGAFIAIPSAKDEVVSARENYYKIRVSEIAMIYGALNGRRQLWAVSAADGAPVPNVKIGITESPYRDSSTTIDIGVTDNDGGLQIPAKSRGAVTASKGSDRFASLIYIGEYTSRDDRPQKRADAYTSLPLYHHGDTVGWSAICYETGGQACRPRAGEKIPVVLRDANYQNIDTVESVSDRYGRITGSFILPAEGLSGHFTLLIDGMTAVSFEVSDYKLPTFQVLPSAVANDTPREGEVTLGGKAVNYSGFPVQDAEVKIALSVSNGWRWGPSYEIETFNDTTDSNGHYSIVIPADVLQNSPFPKGYYTASVSVTSSAGETQTASLSFSRGRRYNITAVTPAIHSLSNKSLTLTSTVKDFSDSPVGLSVNIALSNGRDTVSRAVADPCATISLDGISQGVYTLTFTCEEADTLRREIIIYDPEAAESPCPGQLLWPPMHTVTTDLDGHGSWLVAASCPTHILATLSTSDSIISQQWIDAAKGFNRLPVNLPAGVDQATLTYAAVGDYRNSSGSVTISRKDSEKGLRIITETFRDNLEPGSTETVIFRVTDLQGHGRETAVIAGMYNSAINAIASARPWSFNASPARNDRFSINISPSGGSWSSFRIFRQRNTRRRCTELIAPLFNTWGRPFNSYLFGGTNLMSRYYKSAMRATATAGSVDGEEVMDVVEQISYDSAAPMAMMTLSEPELIAGRSIEESAADNEADAGNAGAPETDAGGEVFNYRESVVPLAFFRPDLITDPDGNLALKFTVPDANATWRLQLLAFTDSLLSANYSRELTVSRRVMVQPNMPRFVRSGDTVVIPVTVMNNCDSTLTATVSLDCYDPYNGKELVNVNRAVEISAHSSVVSSITVNVPDAVSSLGFRVKAISDLGSDGERSVIPVLPSLTVVRESVPFYLAPGGGTVTLDIPAMPRGGNATMQICTNPAWSVVTALPGLLTKQAVTSIEAAEAIFAASVATGLVKDNPAIARALTEWTARGSKTDELSSMLERNEDLKIMLLNATPWISEAKDDTQRMSRLALLFDTKLIDKAINDNIALLSRLATPSGGWKWSPLSDDASEWATSSVLNTLGHVVQLGYLPASGELKRLLTKALAWDTSLTLKQFKKYPDGDYTEYVDRHTLYAPLGIGKPETTIVNATIRHILSTWRNAPLTTKAIDARLLFVNGYQEVARSILTSIREFAISDASRGMWFPSLTDNPSLGSMEILSSTSLILETIAQIDPTSTDIDGLRQWLILSKGAQNWGTSTAATQIIASILTTSRRWIATPSNALIKIDGRLITSDEINHITGEWETVLEPKRVSGKKVKAEVKTDSPSWGALYCSYEAPGDSVKATSCPELSLTRTLLPPADSLSLGGRVTVLLTLKANEDMDYVVIDDQRGACFEPVDQLPATVWTDGVRAYRVSGDTSTRFFIDRLRRGTYQITYDVYVNNAGTFTSGIATVQSQYAPRFTAHSSGTTLYVK